LNKTIANKTVGDKTVGNYYVPVFNDKEVSMKRTYGNVATGDRFWDRKEDLALPNGLTTGNMCCWRPNEEWGRPVF